MHNEVDIQALAEAIARALPNCCRPVRPPVMPTPPVIPPIAPIPPQPEFRVGHVSTQGSNLNLRSEPSVGAPILAQMRNGAPVLVLGEMGEWYHVFWNGLIGYAAKEWIQA